MCLYESCASQVLFWIFKMDFFAILLRLCIVGYETLANERYLTIDKTFPPYNKSLNFSGKSSIETNKITCWRYMSYEILFYV